MTSRAVALCHPKTFSMCNGSLLGSGGLPEVNVADHGGPVQTKPQDGGESGKRRTQRALYGPPSQSVDQVDRQIGALLAEASKIEQLASDALPENQTPFNA